MSKKPVPSKPKGVGGEAKNRIKKLIEKYDRLSEFEKRDKNEMTTRKDFVLRLFDALGWDVYNSYV